MGLAPIADFEGWPRNIQFSHSHVLLLKVIILYDM